MSISKILIVIAVLLSVKISIAQIKNVKTARVAINGNCEMCKATIENAGNQKRTATVTWNKDTKIADISYDSEQTSADDILKRIALAGYDNEKFRAPEDVYAKLHSCCRYDRAIKTIAKTDDTRMKLANKQVKLGHKVSPVDMLYNTYYSLKDALTRTDVNNAGVKAAEFVLIANKIEMDKLTKEEHQVWMKLGRELVLNAEEISKSKDIAKQRSAFSTLSEKVYALAKVSKHDSLVYYQHCPMYNNGEGANWLSKEKVVKNPYFGMQMLNCGNVQETIGIDSNNNLSH